MICSSANMKLKTFIL